MYRPLRLAVFFLMVLTTCAWAQSEYHLTRDPNHWIYQNSSFAHGHRHGYEEGFHAGNEDYHFRKSPAPQQKMPKSRGYRPEFGNKASFERGFEKGFLAGYADSYAGHAFRATQSLLDSRADASLKIQNELVREFDLGIAEGYRAGFANLASIANEPGVAESASWRCRQEPHSAVFCDGYGPGYVLGRADSDSVSVLAKSNTTSLARNSH